MRQATISQGPVGGNSRKYAGRKPHKTYEAIPAEIPEAERDGVVTLSHYRKTATPTEVRVATG